MRGVAEVGVPQVDDELALQGRRQGGVRRQPQQGYRGACLDGQRRRPEPPGLQHRGRGRPGEEDAAADEPTHPHQVDRHLHDDPEADLAAADGPEQVGIVVVVHDADLAVAGDDGQRPDAVRGEAEPAGQQSQSAAEGVTDGADGRGRSVQGRQPVRGRGVDDRPPAGAGADRGRCAHRVDRYPVQTAGADQQGAGQVVGQAVPGGLHGDSQAGVGGPGDRGGDVLGTGGADHHRGRGSHGQVEPGDLGGVIGMVGGEHGPGDGGHEIGHRKN